MAFFVLMFSTMDLRVGLISTVTIAGVVTTVMGVGVHGIMKWSLGIGESIAAVILIGLSVDYCVHLANAYVEAPLVCDTRELRTQHALMTMGISITASAITTIIRYGLGAFPNPGTHCFCHSSLRTPVSRNGSMGTRNVTFLLLVTLTGVLAAVTNTSQSHCSARLRRLFSDFPE